MTKKPSATKIRSSDSVLHVSLRSITTLVPVIQPHKWFVIKESHSGVKVSTQDRLAEPYKTLQVQLNMQFISETLI